MKTKRHISVPHILYAVITIGMFAAAIAGAYYLLNPESISTDPGLMSQTDNVIIEIPTEEVTYPTVEYPSESGGKRKFDDKIVSKYAVLIDVDENKVLAGRDENEIMYPASMTKIMTLIVAVENLESLDDTFTMTYDILSPLVDADASRAGFEVGETVTAEDLLYGAVLPSGADATVGLAELICGSEKEFVRLMNEKAAYMGLEHTHFTNTSGLHDKDHYSTAVEIGMILEYAMQNDICREVLSTYQYTTSKTKQHPEGIPLESTMFSRMYGDEVDGVLIEGGKTGYTDEAESCLASFAVKNGHEYVAVTSGSYDYWLTIYDAFEIYRSYIG